jgi:hypothetical protein
MQLQIPSEASFMHKVDTQIDMFGTLAAADGAFRPGNASFIVGKNWSRSRLGKTKITRELAEIDYLLNHSR